MDQKIVKKAFFNKNNKQFTVSIPKKEFKAVDPKIKFGDHLFVELKLIKKNKKLV